METMLVTGASGLLGSSVCKAAASQYKVYGTFLNHPVNFSGVETFKVDLTNNDSISFIEKKKPDVIIHCAAMTNIDACEERPDEAHKQNVVVTRNVAEAAKRSGAYLVHISTESVFDGQREQYKEEDKPNPLNVYARTKLEAEGIALAVPGAAVARTTIYGWNVINKQSLSEWILAKLSAGESVPGFTDAIFSPILTDDLAKILLKLCDVRPSGILHISGCEACSKFTFAQELAVIYGFDKSRVKEAHIAGASFRAKRPFNVSLDVSKAEQILGIKFQNIREGLERFKKSEPSRASKASVVK